MKKAFLVDFIMTTRVVVDVPDGMDTDAEDNLAIQTAYKKIDDNLYDYFTESSCFGVEQDIECPAGTFKEDRV